MLHVATQIPEQCDYPGYNCLCINPYYHCAYTFNSYLCISVSIKTRQHVAIFLAKLYDDMVFDQRRQTFKERCDHVLKLVLCFLFYLFLEFQSGIVR